MDDNQIIELYFARNEQAIKETDAKYGKLCFSVANRILENNEDSEECVNDTYLNAWNKIPPTRPNHFSAFLCKITRLISLKKLEFSKWILLFETVLVAYVSQRVLGFVEMAIADGFTGSLPYLTTFISAVWAAYGASVGFYQNKSGKENVKKIEVGAKNTRPDCD